MTHIETLYEIDTLLGKGIYAAQQNDVRIDNMRYVPMYDDPETKSICAAGLLAFGKINNLAELRAAWRAEIDKADASEWYVTTYQKIANISGIPAHYVKWVESLFSMFETIQKVQTIVALEISRWNSE